jgi:hypothetical protein
MTAALPHELLAGPHQLRVQPSTDNHADKAISSWVVVLNDRTSRFTAPSTVWRVQATTASL